MNGMRIVEGLAIVMFGVLALVLAFAFAVSQDATLGALAAVLAAGVSYVFQATVYAARGDWLDDEEPDEIVGVPALLIAVLYRVPPVLFVASICLSFIGV